MLRLAGAGQIESHCHTEPDSNQIRSRASHAYLKRPTTQAGSDRLRPGGPGSGGCASRSGIFSRWFLQVWIRRAVVDAEASRCRGIFAGFHRLTGLANQEYSGRTQHEATPRERPVAPT